MAQQNVINTPISILNDDRIKKVKISDFQEVNPSYPIDNIENINTFCIHDNPWPRYSSTLLLDYENYTEQQKNAKNILEKKLIEIFKKYKQYFPEYTNVSSDIEIQNTITTFLIYPRIEDLPSTEKMIKRFNKHFNKNLNSKVMSTQIIWCDNNLFTSEIIHEKAMYDEFITYLEKEMKFHLQRQIKKSSRKFQNICLKRKEMFDAIHTLVDNKKYNSYTKRSEKEIYLSSIEGLRKFTTSNIMRLILHLQLSKVKQKNIDM